MDDFGSKPGSPLKGIIAVVISLAIVGAMGWFVVSRASSMLSSALSSGDGGDYEGEGGEDINVVIGAGIDGNGIGDILVEAGVVRSIEAWQAALKDEPKANQIQAGKYALKRELPAKAALQRLLDPKFRVKTSVVLTEGMTLRQQVQRLSQQTKIPTEDFQAALADPEALGLPAWANGNPEGFIFPDTYEFTDQSTAASILKAAVSRFNKVITDLGFIEAARASNQTPRDALISASIIEREVRRDADQPKVARVILNRLKAGMALGMDSTIKYITERYGSVDTTPAERKIVSPYNTYLNKGLPKGPISAPGAKALKAAASPAAGTWEYFVTVNVKTGETLFSTTAEEHKKNVAKYQAYCNANPGVCNQKK